MHCDRLNRSLARFMWTGLSETGFRVSEGRDYVDATPPAVHQRSGAWAWLRVSRQVPAVDEEKSFR